MKIVTAEEMRIIDEYAINELKIPSLVLMENAGRGAAKVAYEVTKDSILKKTAIFCGKGNNGGDGFVIARHLANWGFDVTVFLCCDEKDIKGDPLIYYKIIKEIGVKIEYVTDDTMSFMEEIIKGSTLLIDSLLGTGIKGKPVGLIEKVIKAINNTMMPVLAVDIPSGLNGTTGEIAGECVAANWTVTFGYIKRGMLTELGESFCGDVTVEDITIPPWVPDVLGFGDGIITENCVRKSIPPIFSHYHKGNRGRVLVVGGSKGMTGAAILTATAAARAGAGMVTLAMGESLNIIGETNTLEVMTLPLPEESGILSLKTLDTINGYQKRGINAITFGTGLSVKKGYYEILEGLIDNLCCPMVIDADGLNILSQNPDILTNAEQPVILTPHLGEFSRLIGASIEKIQRNRIELVREYSAKWNTIILLKGPKTLVSSWDGKVMWNMTGNPGMATAGSGDVLTGIIGSLIAQGGNPIDSAAAGAYIHGLAGDMAAAQLGMRGLLAGDMVEILPLVLKKLEYR
jgi:NAD(P)H-hydrate epimerase